MRANGTSKRATVTVEGNQMEIWVAQAGATGWRAWGFYNSKHIEARGPTVDAAAQTWKTKASGAARMQLQ